MSRRLGIPWIALLVVTAFAPQGCKKKDKDDHWTGGSSMGAQGTDMSAAGEQGEPRASLPARPDQAMGADPGRPAGVMSGDAMSGDAMSGDAMSGDAMSGDAMSGDDPGPAVDPGKSPKVAFRTSMGDFLVELDPRKAPITVKSFLRYVDEKFYDGTIFHRVMVNFMIQGGGFGEDLQQKQPHDPIKNEADNGLRNLRGTIAMARTQVVDSATAQFFINVKDNPPLDHRGPGPHFGYAVFGKVVQGMDVVDRIRGVQVQSKGMMFQHLPLTPVVIKSVRRVP